MKFQFIVRLNFSLIRFIVRNAYDADVKSKEKGQR